MNLIGCLVMAGFIAYDLWRLGVHNPSMEAISWLTVGAAVFSGIVFGWIAGLGAARRWD